MQIVGWEIDNDDIVALIRLVRLLKPSSVLEIGSGQSTLLWAYLGLKAHTFEYATSNKNSELAAVPGVKVQDFNGLARHRTSVDSSYDIAFIGAPPEPRVDRSEALRFAQVRAPLIIIHDANGDTESSSEMKVAMPCSNAVAGTTTHCITFRRGLSLLIDRHAFLSRFVAGVTDEDWQAMCTLEQLEFIYERKGFDQRPLSLGLGGLILTGRACCETFWCLRGGDLCLISDTGDLTCSLRRTPDGIWSGRWLRFERMPINLRPLIKNRSAEHLSPGTI